MLQMTSRTPAMTRPQSCLLVVSMRLLLCRSDRAAATRPENRCGALVVYRHSSAAATSEPPSSRNRLRTVTGEFDALSSIRHSQSRSGAIRGRMRARGSSEDKAGATMQNVRESQQRRAGGPSWLPADDANKYSRGTLAAIVGSERYQAQRAWRPTPASAWAPATLRCSPVRRPSRSCKAFALARGGPRAASQGEPSGREARQNRAPTSVGCGFATQKTSKPRSSFTCAEAR